MLAIWDRPVPERPEFYHVLRPRQNEWPSKVCKVAKVFVTPADTSNSRGKDAKAAKDKEVEGHGNRKGYHPNLDET